MITIILQIILGLFFIMAGSSKFSSEQQIEGFKNYGYSSGFRIFTGTVELLAAVLLIAGIWISTLAAFGALLVVATMIGAILTHIKIKDSLKDMSMPIILLIIGAGVLTLNYSHILG